MNIKGETPLLVTALYGFKVVMQDLLQAGADPNKRRNDGLSPLHFAALFGLIDLVKMLLAAGADPKVVDGKEEDPQCWAMKHKFRRVAELLQNNASM